MRYLLPLFLCALALAPPARAVDAGQLDISLSGTNALLTWTNSAAVLEQTLDLVGPWCQIVGASSPYTSVTTNVTRFFRLRGEPPGDPRLRYLAPTFTIGIGDPVSGCACTSPENPNSGVTANGSAQDNGMGSVLLHTGELTQNAVDLAIPGRGFDWRFARRYRSGMSYDGPLGHGWDFSYNRRLSVEPDGNVLCMDGLGRADRYTLNTNGTFDSPPGFYTRLRRNPDGTFDERDRNGMTHSYSATNSLSISRLTCISDRNGNQMTFQYNSAGELTSVIDTLGRPIAYHYDANGRLTDVTDFAGRSVRFGYDANGNLISATSPAVSGTTNGNDFLSGKTTLYSYASGFGDPRFNHNLLSVTAPNEVAAGGPPRLSATYDTSPASPHADRLLSLFLGGTNASGVPAGGTIRYAYTNLGPASLGNFIAPAFQTTVTNRNHHFGRFNVAEYRFNQLGNVVRTRRFTRFLLRPGEPDFFETLAEYNKDGEMLRRTNAELDSVEHVFNAASPDRFQQGNLLEVRRYPGPRGGDQAQIITSQTYETNFNYVATSTDGRGSVTTHRYDAKGNRTNTVHRIPSIVEDFQYNAFGQMTARVLPDNGSGHSRRDVMTYYSSGSQNGYLQSGIVDAGPTNLNLTTTYQYDVLGRVLRRIDPRTNDTLYTYNALDQVVRERSREVSPGIRYDKLYWYDDNNNLVRMDVQNRDAAGTLQDNATFTTIVEFDILDQRTREVQEKGSAELANSVVTYAGIPVELRPQFVTVEHRYDANGNRNLTRFGQATAELDPFNLVRLLYDERDLVFLEARAFGSADTSSLQTDYDRNGNTRRTRQGVESAAPRTSTYTYDGYNGGTSTTDAMGNVTLTRYDPNGNATNTAVFGELIDLPGSAGNTNLSSTAFTYDAMDRLVQTDVAFFDTETHAPILDGFATTIMIYSPNSQVLSVTDDNGHTTTSVYDSANRLHETIDAKGNAITYLYDPNSNIQQTTERDRPDNIFQVDQMFVTQNTYDNLDRLIRVVDNVSNTNQYAYDSRGNTIGSINARGNLTLHQYDGLSRLTETDYLLTDTGTGSGTLIGGITNRQTWDDSSRLRSQTDGNTNTTQYLYDPLNRLILTTYADSTTNVSFYDVHDNITTRVDANGTIVSTCSIDPPATTSRPQPACWARPSSAISTTAYRVTCAPKTTTPSSATVTILFLTPSVKCRLCLASY